MAPRLLAPLGALAAAAVALLATPAGVWVAARGAEWAAGSRGYSLSIDQTGGVLVASPRFGGLQAGIRDVVEVRVQELVLHPWDWRLSLRGPEIRSRLKAVADTAAHVPARRPASGAPLLLPLADLPRIDVVDGVFELIVDDRPSLKLRGIEAQVSPGGPSEAVVDLSAAARWTASDSISVDGRLSTRWRLAEREVELEEAQVDWRVPGVGQGIARGRGRFEFGSVMDIDVGLTLRGQVGSMQVERMEAAARGTAFPPRIDVRAHAEGSGAGLGEIGLDLAGRLDTSGFRADSLRLQAAGGTLRGSGRYRPAPARLAAQVELRGIDLGRLPLRDYAGTVDGRVTVDGALSSPRASLALTVAGLEGIAPRPVDLSLDGSIEEERLLLRARSPRLGELTASGDLSLKTARYDLQLAGDLDVGPWLGSALPASVRGRWRPETLDLRLQSERMPFGLGLTGPLVADATLHDFRHLDLTLALGTGQLSARLGTDLSSPQLDTLSVAALGLDLSQVAAVVGGKASGSVAVDGLFGQDGRGGLQLQVDDLRLAGWSLGPTRLAADYVRDAVDLSAAAPGVDLQARVDSAGRTRVQVSLEGAVLRRVGASDSVRVLGGLASASGDLNDPLGGSLEVRIDGASASFRGWPVALNGTSVLEYADGRCRLHPSLLRTPLGEVRVAAGVDDGHLDLTASLDSVESTGIADLTARGRAILRLEGAPMAPHLALRADLDDLSLQGRSIGALRTTLDLGDSLRASLEVRQDTARAVQFHLGAPATVLTGGPPAGSDSLRMGLRAENLDATWLATYILGDSTGLRVSAEAELSLPAAQVPDGFDWVDLAGSLRLSELSLERERLRVRLPQPAALDLAGGEAFIEGFELPVLVFPRDADLPEEEWDVTLPGRYEEAGVLSLEARPGVGGSAVRLRLKGVDLEAVTLAIPGGPGLPAGRIDASLRMVSRAGGTTSLSGRARADLDDLGYLDASLSAGVGQWSARGTWVTLVEDSLVVTAAVPLTEGRPLWEGLSLTARSEGIDLLILLDQVPLESLSGRVRLDLTADSLRDRPRIAGEVEVEDLSFSLIDIRPGYRFPRGSLVLAPRAGGGTRGELVGLLGDPTQGPGHLQVEGWVEVAALNEVDYELRLSGEVPYNYSDYFAAPRVGLDLALTGEPEGSLLKGTIGLHQSLSEVQLVELTGPVPPPPAVQDPLLGGVGMDVYVDIVELKSRSELSDIEVDGRVRVYGTFYKPRFQGELEVKEGTVILLSRPFAFTPGGRVVLDRLVPTYSILDLLHEPILLDPEFDLEAVTRVQVPDEDEELVVTLDLEGTALSPDPELTSPGLAYRQIIGLLAFGTLDQNRYNYSGALYTAAGQLLLGRRVQKAGLDEFLLLPSGTAQGTIGETSIRIGKRLTWPLPMWVRYEAITKDPSLGEFEVEYGFTSWLLLKATAHSQHELYGLGLEVSKDF